VAIDLAGRRAGQGVDELDVPGELVAAEALAHVGLQRLGEIGR
jgi:hypothetical protein